MRYWHEAKRFAKDQFTVVWDWTYEEVPIRDMFDETVFDIADMERRHNAGIDTHYIARVTFLYDGEEVGSATLGSCYAHGCDPEDDMKAGISGYMEDMMEEAESEARERAVEMLDRLKKDFLGVDNGVETV